MRSCIVSVMLVFYSLFAFADIWTGTTITASSGSTYYSNGIELDPYKYPEGGHNHLTVNVTGTGVLSFDAYVSDTCNGGGYVRVRLFGTDSGLNDSPKQPKTYKIPFTSNRNHSVTIEYGCNWDGDCGGGGGVFVSNVKWVQGATLVASEIYECKDNEEGNLDIVGSKVPLEGEITLPQYINGKKVTGIDNRDPWKGALLNSGSITAITIPASIVNIKGTRRNFPVSASFTKLTVAAGNPNLRAVSNMLIDKNGKLIASAYQSPVNNANFKIPEGVTEIGAFAFTGCFSYYYTGDIVIPSSVTNIANNVFGGCGGIVSLPDTIKHIGENAFLKNSDWDDYTDCYLPVRISSLSAWCGVDCDYINPLRGGWDDYYADLYFYLGSEEIHLPMDSVTIPAGIKRIGHNSLCRIATKYYIPAEVEEVTESLFFGYDATEYHFAGDAPRFVKTPAKPGYGLGVSRAVAYVEEGSNGWGAVPGSWNGVATRYEGKVRFDVSLNLGGGSLDLEKMSVVSNEPYGTLPTPSRDGYGFVGWYSQASYGTKIESSTIAGKEATLYARWKAITYSISYTNTNGMANGNATSYTVESEIVFKPLSNKEGWNFVRWEPAAIAKGTTGNITVEAIWEEDVPDDPKITIDSNGDSAKAPCRVEITCEKANAKIYYSTNGRTPRIVEDNLYKGPFEIEESKTIIAVAVIGEFQSEYVTREIVVAPLTLADALDDENADVATGGDSKWFVELNSSAKNGKAVVRSGAIGMEQQTWLEMKVAGRGTLSFWWKVSCEPDPRGKYTYDHVEFAENQETKFRLDGETDWAQETIEFETEGEHTVRWTYLTDDWETAGYNDCAWVDCVVWSPIPTPNLPTELEGASEGTKAAFDEWVKKHGVQNPSAANVNAFILGLAPNATEEEIQAQVEAEIENIDLSKLATDPAAAVEAIQAKYPNAKIELKPMENITTSAHLYKLVIDIK